MALMKFREPNQVRWQGVRPGHNGTQVLAFAFADNETTDIYTVPAGKTFFLTWYSLGLTTVAAGNCSLQIRTPVPVVLLVLDRLFFTVAGNMPSVSQSLTFPIEVASTYLISVVSSAAGLRAYGNIVGWVE